MADTSSQSDLDSLLELARSGHQESMGQLFQEYRAYLKVLATKGINDDVKAKLSGSDVVQETFVTAKENFASFRGRTPEQLKAWLRQILVNNLLDHYRRYRTTQKRDVARELNIQELASEPLDDRHGDTPSQNAIKHEESLRLDQALGSLPREYLTIIDLRHREQLSFAEIGSRVGQSADAVRFTWYRAIDVLSKKLQS